ncbi:hypothetical protein MIR68_007276 [Amoeboaphelidium protococcarum]|nr:hypothetical protein MIR68_007276 [Amoeboaphelidium protococcarum]
MTSKRSRDVDVIDLTGSDDNEQPEVQSSGGSSSAKKLKQSSCGNVNSQFYFTKVDPLPAKFNQRAVTMSQLLNPNDGVTLCEMFQFNFEVDLDWLMMHLPSAVRSKIPVTVYHGWRRPESIARYKEQAQRYKNVTSHSPPLPIAYGTHHTKMMVLLFNEYQQCQIVISTANLHGTDYGQDFLCRLNINRYALRSLGSMQQCRLKTQALWRSPMLQLKAKSGAQHGDQSSRFERDFLDYLAAYGQMTSRLRQLVATYDMVPCDVVHLIASVPGRHTGQSLHKYGHMKLRAVLKAHYDSTKGATCASKDFVICQMSSIGSLGASADSWLTGEFLTSLSSSQSKQKPTLTSALSKQNLQCDMKLVFPTVDNVRNSLEGYDAGGSIPFDEKNWIKQRGYMQPLLHSWQASMSGRTRCMPHIKTFTRIRETDGEVGDGDQIQKYRPQWFLLTSANLSKAAWGQLEKNGVQLMIRSYELGVLIVADSAQGLQLETLVLPYDLPLTKYKPGDRVWTWNGSHPDPDIFGRRINHG